MANKPITMQQMRMLIQLLEKGYSGRRIARELQLARNTVGYYTRRLQDSGYSLSELRNIDDASLSAIVYDKANLRSANKQGNGKDADELNRSASDERRAGFDAAVALFRSELKRTGVTRQLLWREYKQANPDGYGYSQFCQLLRCGLKITEATMHFSYRPAEIMMVDFAGDTLHYVEKETGLVIACPVFVCILPYSGYGFVLALPNATSPQVIKGLNGCLNFFGGVPQSIKCDNMAQAVRKSCRYEPVFTDVLLAWALHNNLTLTAARPGKPKDKASVENLVKLAYQRVYAPLRDKVFFSLNELNEAIVKQLKLHHEQFFQRKDYSRKDCFDKEEQSLLLPLPATPYCIRHAVQAKVQKNYHIVLGEDWHYYSVPFNHIGNTVNVIYDSDTVEIYYEHKRIALHRRSYKKHGYTTVKEHMPESHKRYSEQRGWDADYFLRQAEKIGHHAHAYIEGVLKRRQFSEQAYNSCLGILRLAKTYGNDRMEAACKRAVKGNAYNYRTLHNILLNNLDLIKEIEQPDLFSIPVHENLRGAQAYE